MKPETFTMLITIISSAVSGGVVSQVLSAIFLPRTKKSDIATEIRDELREDIQGYKNEVRALREEVENWKRKYFRIINFLIKQKVELPEEYWADHSEIINHEE